MPEAASSWFLSRVVGMQTALEWCFTGRVFNAQEAKERGLVRSLHAPDELLPVAQALARDIASIDPATVQIYKRLIDDGCAVPFGEALDRDRRGRPLPVWRGCLRIRDGQVPKVKVYDKAAPSQRPVVVPTPEMQRTRDRAAPAPVR